MRERAPSWGTSPTSRAWQGSPTTWRSSASWTPPARPTSPDPPRRWMLMPVRTLWAPMLLVALLSSAVTVALTWLVLPAPSRAAPDPQTAGPIIRTQRLELVNDAGEVRAMLVVLPTGGAGLYLWDADTQ